VMRTVCWGILGGGWDGGGEDCEIGLRIEALFL